jgi:ankyrin repeat protein
MAVDFQDIEEKCIKQIESDNIDYFKEHIDNIFTINSVLRSKNKIWDTNYLSILGKFFKIILFFYFHFVRLKIAIACYSGSTKIVKYLIDHKVQINQIDILKRRSALHWAVASGNFEIVKILIDAGI